MRIRNVVEKANNVKINESYDAGVLELLEIVNAYNHPFDSCCTAFKYGYMQGVKAEKAEQKKKQ